jgi:hypothetical protein
VHRATPRFWRCYERLPAKEREHADRAFALLRENPRHPSLNLKKVGPFWSARVDISLRALAVKEDEDFIWVWIGHHGEYDRMVR